MNGESEPVFEIIDCKTYVDALAIVAAAFVVVAAAVGVGVASAVDAAAVAIVAAAVVDWPSSESNRNERSVRQRRFSHT
jgi:NhaP-type Na+/H+ or K+/H+ antiporter